MATFKDGNSTEVVKLQLESVISYNLGTVKDVGKLAVTEPGSGTWTEDDECDLPAGGENLVVRANTNIKSESDIGVTVEGTGDDDAPLTGTCTIEKLVAEGQSYDLRPSVEGKKFKAIASVTVSNGIAGDGFDICVLPAEANDVEVGFDQGLQTNPGNQVKPIYRKYELDHNKRIRGDKKLTLGQFYTNNLTGLARINNRDVVIIQRFKDDGSNLASEIRYFDTCRLGISVESPSADDGEVKANGEGNYGRAFIFS